VDLNEAVRSQRAHRAFLADAVPDDLVESVLAAATYAPSAENSQPWVFVVVREDDRRAAIGEVTRAAWERGGRAYAEQRLAPGLLADVDQGARGGVASAPVLVVVCGDTRRCSDAMLGASVFPAVQNLLLTATALGLGSAVTTLPTVGSEALATLLGLPSEVVPLAVVPLGWPARRLGPPRREPVADHAYRETFGSGW
jgi:nitroreductase